MSEKNEAASWLSWGLSMHAGDPARLQHASRRENHTDNVNTESRLQV